MSETIYFKIKSEKNPDVFISGYVDINDENAEDVDWYFNNKDGVPTPHVFIEHLGVDGFKGATMEQEFEIDEFKNIYIENIDVIDDIVLQSNDGDKFTLKRNGLIFEIGGE